MNEPLHLAPAIEDDEGLLQKKARHLLGRSWRTSLAGAATLGCGVAVAADQFISHPVLHTIASICIAAGLVGGGGGLILAKDKGVSGTAR